MKTIFTRVKLSKKHICLMFLYIFIAAVAEMMLPT